MSMTDTAMYEKLNDAIGAHGEWKFKLRVAAHKGDTDNLLARASDCHACAFGRWFDSLPATLRAAEVAQDVQALHETFHRHAGEVAQHIVKGHKDTALALLDGAFSDVSRDLTGAMTRWKFALTR